MVNPVISVIRTIAFHIDRLIYGWIPEIYDFIIEIAGFEIFSTERISDVANSIYVILGLVMLFRLAFSLLSTIVNPDLLTDQQQGFGNIVQRSMIALALIVIIPLVFTYGFRFQKALINENNNVFMKLFVGTVRTDEIKAGKLLGEMTLRAFIECIDPMCHEDIVNEETGEVIEKKGEEKYKLSRLLQNIEDLSEMQEQINKNSIYGSGYIYNYSFIFSIPCGGFILIMLIVFCLDIALRTVKLGFLQIITPVAVVSYIDPKSSESGFFNKWVQACINTYLILFFRIVAVSFMVFIITLLPGLRESLKDESLLLIVFIILGIVLFAKDLPKILSDLFGIEDISLGTLNPFKRYGEIPGVSTVAGLGMGVAGTAVGGLFGGIAGGVIGGRGAVLGGISKGIGSRIGGVREAKGDILGQVRGAISPFGTYGAVARHLKGDDYRWGFGKVADKLSANAMRAQYERQIKEEAKKYGNIYNAIEAAENEKFDASHLSADQQAKLAERFNVDRNNEYEWGRVLQTMGKVERERKEYSTAFGNAFASVEYSKEALKGMTDRLKEADYQLENNQISVEQYNKIAAQYEKAKRAVTKTEETFEKIKESYTADAKKYDGIRSYESRKKTSAASKPLDNK